MDSAFGTFRPTPPPCPLRLSLRHRSGQGLIPDARVPLVVQWVVRNRVLEDVPPDLRARPVRQRVDAELRPILDQRKLRPRFGLFAPTAGKPGVELRGGATEGFNLRDLLIQIEVPLPQPRTMLRLELLAAVVALEHPQVEIVPLPDTLDELERLGKVMQRVDEDDGEANPYLVKHVEQDEASGAEGRHDREAARLEVLHRLRKEAFQREPVQGRGEARSPPRRQPGFE